MRAVLLCDWQGDNDDDLPTLRHADIPPSPPPPVELNSSDDDRAACQTCQTALSPPSAPHCCSWHPWLRALDPLAAAPAVNGFCCHPISKTGTHAVGVYATHSNDKVARVQAKCAEEAGPVCLPGDRLLFPFLFFFGL